MRHSRITGSLEGGHTAPLIVVEGEEITTLLITTTVEIIRRLVTVGLNIGSRVPNRDLSVVVSLDVLPHVTLDGLRVRCGRSSVVAVDDFVTGEE